MTDNGNGDQAAADDRPQVGNLPRRAPVAVARDVTIREAAARMRAENVSSVLVETEPVSFVSERDVCRAVAEGIGPDQPVERIATRAPVWVPPTLSVLNAAAVMVGLGIRHLVVISATGQPVGVVSMRDVFDVLLTAADPAGWRMAIGLAPGDAG